MPIGNFLRNCRRRNKLVIDINKQFIFNSVFFCRNSFCYTCEKGCALGREFEIHGRVAVFVGLKEVELELGAELHGNPLLLRLLDGGSAIGLCSLICGRVRELICAKSLAARGESGLVAKELKKQDWQVRNLGRWAGNFRDGELELLLSKCADADAALKSGADEQSTLTALVCAVCGR